jgi:hypothetical protein
MPNIRWAFAAASVLVCASPSELSSASNTVRRSSSSYIVDVKETEDGLPQNSVIAITQTRDGYLWLGTLNGLVRFDGTRFTVFDESNTPGLNSGRIVLLFEDSQSNFWIGTETAGVVLIKEGRVKSLDIGLGRREGRLMAACEDPSGAVWLYTADGQLCRHRDGRVDVWSVGADRFSTCRVVTAEKSGSLWIGTDWGLMAIGPTAALDPRELPYERTVAVDKLDFLLASQQAGYCVWPTDEWKNGGQTKLNEILEPIRGAAAHESPPLVKTWRETWWWELWAEGFGGMTPKARRPASPPIKACPATTSSPCTWIVTTRFGWAPTAAV